MTDERLTVGITAAEMADLINQVADSIERLRTRPAYIQWAFPEEWHRSRAAPARSALSRYIRRGGVKRPWHHLDGMPLPDAARLVRDCADAVRSGQWVP